jgi:phytoene dehydrogenase-like protein
VPDFAGDRRDVVVIGGGLSGLTAGALLARAGQKTLVVEANDKAGGYAASIDEGGYRFEPAIHLAMGGNESGPFGPGLVHQVLDLLGVVDRCQLVRVDPFYTVRFPGLTLQVDRGRDGYLGSHLDQFPTQEESLTGLISIWSNVHTDFLKWPISPTLMDWPTAPVRWPRLVRYLNSTIDRVTKRFLSDPDLRAVHHALSPAYLGLPPSRASFLIWAVMMSSYVEEGAFSCIGGFQSLADAIADGLTSHGGELILGRKVIRIEVDSGQAKGVLLDDGRRIRGENVVSTIDARDTFEGLIESEHLPSRWMRRIRTAPLSISIFGLYLGTDLDLTAINPSLETFVMTDWDLEDGFRSEIEGKPGNVTVTIPTLADSGLAPDGHHQIIVQGAAPTDPEAVNETEIASHYLRLAQQVIPDLGNHITHALGADQGATGPSSLPLHRIGPIYGWDNSPSSSAIRRLPQKTPLKGLYLAGQWTQPGHGVWTVIASGVQAARLILNKSIHTGMYPIRL